MWSSSEHCELIRLRAIRHAGSHRKRADGDYGQRPCRLKVAQHGAVGRNCEPVTRGSQDRRRQLLDDVDLQPMRKLGRYTQRAHYREWLDSRVQPRHLDI
jgi:hypothetical protein